MTHETERKDILTQSLEGRKREVMTYQINIDNYRAALEEIGTNYADDPAMVEFAEQLQNLLETTLVEQKKEQIMVTVLTRQLEKMQ